MYFREFPFEGFGQASQAQQSQSEPIENEAYYKLLEVSKNATTEEIKKAFKKKAIKMHPDKGGDPQAFAELSLANDTLSDPEKRKVYDKYGEKGIKQGINSTEPKYGDLFDLFNGGGKNQKTEQNGKQRTKDIVVPIKVTLSDVYTGKLSKFRITRKKNCQQCNGVGGKFKNHCQDCNGSGVLKKIAMLGPGMYAQTQQKCINCGGLGSFINPQDECNKCKGLGFFEEKKIFNCEIPSGVPDGYAFTFYGESNEAQGLVPGDIIAKVQVLEHQKFKRKGFDLVYKAKINLSEALAGFKMEIIHLDEKPRHIVAQPGEIIQPGDLKTIKELGLPKFTTPYEFGNLFIVFDVEFPSKGTLSQQAIQNLRRVLPPSQYSNMQLILDPKQNYETKEFSQQHLNPYKESRTGEAYDEDDYKNGRGERIQCHQT